MYLSIKVNICQLQDKNLLTTLWSIFILKYLIIRNLNESDHDNIIISAEKTNLLFVRRNIKKCKMMNKTKLIFDDGSL